MLQNPDVLRSLSNLKQIMSQAQGKQHPLDEEKARKLREMKQQEEKFDKHLAQTVPVFSYFLIHLSCNYLGLFSEFAVCVRVRFNGYC